RARRESWASHRIGGRHKLVYRALVRPNPVAISARQRLTAHATIISAIPTYRVQHKRTLGGAMIVKRPGSDNVARNCLQELRDQGVNVFRVFAVSEVKTLEGAGNQSLVDFGLAMGRILTSPLKGDLRKAGGKCVSPAFERMSLLTCGDN